MIPVGWDEILSRLARVPPVLKALQKLHPAITCRTFHHGKTGSLFCTAGVTVNKYSPKKNTPRLLFSSEKVPPQYLLAREKVLPLGKNIPLS